ncbi:uncharacterized protein LOC119995553 [Tripterygium wilfordii]|uniref:uncharacterized protein LOC119995553 n=1 Tax=Tripterygium wilfordii TaxID=458696 RepID=UPI0018F84965|nr:uncharacterized protein LOC119995553 [Tripterygium wilfordii]
MENEAFALQEEIERRRNAEKEIKARGILNTPKKVVGNNRELKETKIAVFSATIFHSFWGSSCGDWLYIQAKGSYGGIALMWNYDQFEILSHKIGEYSISVVFRSKCDSFMWAISGELSNFRLLWNGPWVIGGDFNDVLYSYERLGARLESMNMTDFQSFVFRNSLRDLPLKHVIQSLIPRPTSDHHPVLLESGYVEWGPTPFRFQNHWLNNENLEELIKRWWNSIQPNGYASFRISEKMKFLKARLKVWSKVVYGEISLRIKSLTEEIKLLDDKENLRGTLSDEDGELREANKREISNLISAEESAWRQKSRICWLKEGDRNTKFFHKMASIHRS